MMIIDRFEGDWAIVETEDGIQRIPRNELPPGAREGDLLVSTPQGYVIDREATRRRQDKLAALRRRIIPPGE